LRNRHRHQHQWFIKNRRLFNLNLLPPNLLWSNNLRWWSLQRLLLCLHLHLHRSRRSR
jgi:hypothetical protein